jgi:hypothetical protein
MNSLLIRSFLSFKTITVKSIEIPYQGNMTLTELKSAFSSLFPYLKWEFFNRHHENQEGSHKKYMITTNPKIVQLNPAIQSGTLQFNSEITVHELEELIWNQCGVDVQVFRKSGNIWLETTVTDQWTLAFQNEQGQELSEQFDRKK